jgi:hypothetical protein
MVRTGWLAALIVVLAPWPSPAQFGGMGGGMGGMGGGMGGMMGNQLWSVAARSQKPLETWEVKVETFGNQVVTGRLQLARVFVQSEVGIYEIQPEKVKTIELSPAQENQMVFTQAGVQRNGTVVTSTGSKIAGQVLVPIAWRIETDLGTLTPDAQQLKTLTFVARAEDPAPKPGVIKPMKPGDNPPAATPSKPGETGKPS